MCSQKAFHTTSGLREASASHAQPSLSSSSCSGQHHLQVAAFCFLVTLCRVQALDIPNPFSVAAVTDDHKLSSFTPARVSVSVCGSGVEHWAPWAHLQALGELRSFLEAPGENLFPAPSGSVLGRIQLFAGDRLKSPLPGWLSAEDCSGLWRMPHCLACGLSLHPQRQQQ